MWSSLVSDEVPGSNPEVVRLNNICRTYESENQRLKLELEQMTTWNNENIARLGEGEKARQVLLKQIRSLESTIKYDKIASDGIAKKASINDFEITNLREEKKNLLKEQSIDRNRLAYLEESNNNDRSKLLREMHESDSLRKAKVSLEVKCNSLESELSETRHNLIERIHRLETLTVENEQQRSIIHEQNLEILKLAQEIAGLKEEKRELCQHSLEQDQVIAVQSENGDQLENEVYRLRSEMTLMSKSNSEKSAAFSSFAPRTASTAQRSLRSRQQVSTPSSSGLLNSQSLPSVLHPESSGTWKDLFAASGGVEIPNNGGLSSSFGSRTQEHPIFSSNGISDSELSPLKAISSHQSKKPHFHLESKDSAAAAASSNLNLENYNQRRQKTADFRSHNPRINKKLNSSVDFSSMQGNSIVDEGKEWSVSPLSSLHRPVTSSFSSPIKSVNSVSMPLSSPSKGMKGVTVVADSHGSERGGDQGSGAPHEEDISGPFLGLNSTTSATTTSSSSSSHYNQHLNSINSDRDSSIPKQSKKNSKGNFNSQTSMKSSLNSISRSRFLGSGLGYLKEKPGEDAISSKGSAKQVLEKILEDFNSQQ